MLRLGGVGMVRSSIDTTEPMRAGSTNDNQYTPAMPQFSAPKKGATGGSASDASNFSPE